MDWDDGANDGEYLMIPEKVESGGFTFHQQRGLHYKNVAPEPVSELRLLFRKNAAKSRLQAANKPWVSAQLRLYDIPFKATAKADDLKATLEAAVKAGKCNKLPPSTIAKESALRKKLKDELDVYERKRQQQHDDQFTRLSSPSDQARFDFAKFLAKYFLDDQGEPAPEKHPDAIVLQDVTNDDTSPSADKIRAIPGLRKYTGVVGSVIPRLAVLGWSGASFERGLDRAFAMICKDDFNKYNYSDSITSGEANFDPNRFLAKYFLSGLKGTPDRQKTPEPVQFSTYLAPAAEGAIRDAAKTIAGLHVAESVRDRYDRWVCIGWGRDKVNTFVQQLDAAATRREEEAARLREAKKEAEEAKRLERKMRSHNEYAKKHRPHTGPLSLNHIVGSYIFECDEMEGYSGTCVFHEYGLNIHPPSSAFGNKATFNFGLVDGLMLMALSEDALELFRQEVGEDEKELSYGSGEEDEDEDEDEDDGNEDQEDEPATNKRKATGQPGGGLPAVKRRLGEAPRPNRVYFRWRGRETGEGQIETGSEDKHTGHFDFDAQGLTAQGLFCHPNFFGDSKKEIGIYKTDDSPQGRVGAWSDLSQKQWNYECSARWH